MKWDMQDESVWHDLRDNDRWILSIRTLSDEGKIDMWRLLVSDSAAKKLPEGTPYKYTGTLVATNLEAAKQEAEKVVLMWIMEQGFQI